MCETFGYDNEAVTATDAKPRCVSMCYPEIDQLPNAHELRLQYWHNMLVRWLQFCLDAPPGGKRYCTSTGCFKGEC